MAQSVTPSTTDSLRCFPSSLLWQIPLSQVQTVHEWWEVKVISIAFRHGEYLVGAFSYAHPGSTASYCLRPDIEMKHIVSF